MENKQLIPAIRTEAIEDQVMRHLEGVDDALITTTEFTDAITKVQKENGVSMTPA